MAVDLNNADLDELDTLLAHTPEPLQPLDSVMLDGYLAGIAVQPHIIPVDAWMPGIFDLAARALPNDADPAWQARCRTLVERRFEVMGTDLAEQRWFDPIIVDVARLPPSSEYETPASDAHRALAPWVAGFELALARFPALQELADPSVDAALARVRKAADGQAMSEPPEGAAAPATTQEAAVDKAVNAMVDAVAQLFGMTEEGRYRVDTIKRAAPKVGRNDPCPCGSGRKFKACHGKA